MAEALYRKYRPQVFSDVVGQEHIERTIKNAIEADQVSHAYLFCGPRGTGKTTTARLLAKALLCEHGPTPEPCGTCSECLDIANGVHPDVYELDAASRTGVENVRDEIINRINFAPTRGKWKVYIIDEVHMLSTAAFNALLKTLEEPPGHVLFILCTTDPQKVPDTIHSRCQRFEFRRLSNDEIVTRLGAICVAEGVEFEGDALDLIAHRAEGGMRNALTALEQLIAFGEGRVTVQGAEDLLGSLGASDMAEIIMAVGKRDAAACFTWTASYIESGADLAQFARDMAEHVRNLYVMSLVGTDAVLEIPEAERRQMNDELSFFGTDRLTRLLGVLGDLIADLRTASNPRLAFEIALTRMIRPDSDLTLEALAERIESLERGALAVLPNNGQTDAVPSAPTQSAPASATLHTEAPTATASPTSTSMPASTASPAPTPSPAPSPTPLAQGDVAGLLANPTALQRVWMSVLGTIKKEKQPFAAMLVGVKVQANATGDAVQIEFPASNPISLSMARKPENFDLLNRAFEVAAGFPVAFELCSAALSNSGQTNAEAFAGASSAPAPATLRTEGVPTESAPIDDLVPVEAYEQTVPFEPDPAPSLEPVSAEQPPAEATPLSVDDLSKMASETFSSPIVFEEVNE